MKSDFYFKLIWIGLFCSFAGCRNDVTPPEISNQPDTISLASELNKFVDLHQLPAYENLVKSNQVSSYDTTGGNNDGFGGQYSFVSRNPDSTLVMFDVQGAGVIYRIWTPTPTFDTLDFYIDGSDRISFSIKYLDLFSGSVDPFTLPLCGNELGGYYCYLPIPFQKGCKIVSRGKKLQFHQIQYKLYPNTVKVRSFSMSLTSEEKQWLERVKNTWDLEKIDITDFYEKEDFFTESNTIVIQPGENYTIFEHNKGGRILGIELSPASVFSGLEKQIDIKITWDNEEVPAIYLPVHDFFGFAFGNPSMQSLISGSRDQANYCYFPMPYDRSARVELLYRANSNVLPSSVIEYNVFYSNQPRNKEIEGKLYTEWHGNFHPEKGEPHQLLKRNGKGHLVGTILQTQGLKSGMTLFFEGDDFTSVDGEPVIHGTGSEDYFNGGWYAFIDRWDTRMSLHLHGSLDYSLPLCRTGGYRLFISDKVSFEKSILHTIEHGPVGNEFPVSYTSVAFYYCDSPVEYQPQPTNETTHVYLPDTLVLYPQLMSYDVWDDIDFRSAWVYNTGGMSFIYSVNDESRLRIPLQDIPADTYALYIDFAKFEEGCAFSVWQRQNQLSPWIKTDSTQASRIEYLYIGDVETGNFKNTLTFRFQTDGKLTKLFLNRLIFVKKR